MFVGNVIVPTFRLRNLMPKVKNIYQTFREHEFSREQFAQAMALNPNGGGFSQKVSDLQNYGLIIKNANGKFSLTELCQKIFQTPDKNQSSSLLLIAFNNVGLWKAISARYKGTIDSTTFAKDLIELTGLDEVKANERRDEIIQEYMKDWEYIKNPSFDQGKQYDSSITSMKKKPEHHPIGNILEIKPKIQDVKLKTQDVRPKEPFKTHPHKWTLQINSEAGNIQLDIYDQTTYNMALALFETIFKRQIK